MKRKLAGDQLNFTVNLLCESMGIEVGPLGVEVEIKPAKEAQTDSQRGMYWATLHEWGKEIGYSAREAETFLHNAVLCEAYGVKETRTLRGNIVEIPNQRSSKANKGEYSELLETLLRLSA